MALVEVARRIKALECPKMGRCEPLHIDEGKRRLQKFSADAFAAGAVIDDEPAQMRDVRA